MTPVGTSEYACARSVFLHLRDVPVGRYIAVPTTFAPREQTTFMLRIYSDRKIESRTLIKHAPSQRFFGCRQAVSVTRITVIEAVLEQEKEMNIYCVLQCGRYKVRTSSVKGRNLVSWDEQFVFHRRIHADDFVVELWSDCVMARNQVLSRTSFTAQIDNDTREVHVKLDDLCGKSMGYLKLVVAAFDDPMYL
ncbi:hypothetical protein RB195_023179 [Necator americanus]|nr:C2 domain protein [Necator americanus]ETN84001.1 C2 domain protein [Necator americanus]